MSSAARHRFPASAQALLPERVELELAPEFGEDPACAPLPRSFQHEFAQPHRHVGRPVERARQRAIRRKKGQARLLAGGLVEHLDRLRPRLALRVVDLARIKHRSLRHAPPAPPVFHHAPVAMFLSVLHPPIAFEVHAPHLRHFCLPVKRVGFPPAAFALWAGGFNLSCLLAKCLKISDFRVQLRTSG